MNEKSMFEGDWFISWLLAWLDGLNRSMMVFTNEYWWLTLSVLLFTGSLFRMVPFQMHYTHSFTQVMLIYVRKIVFFGVLLLFLYPLLMLYLFLTVPAPGFPAGARSVEVFWQWLVSLALENWTLAVNALAVGVVLNLLCSRYLYPLWSALMRKIRVRQYYDVQSDIRHEAQRFKAKDFSPKKYYKRDRTFIGLDENNQPIYVPVTTWCETNMQIIGPTRFGKGVILGTLMDQAIRRGDSLVYVDPKNDRFAPHILHQACVETGRPFYYVTLHDDGVGSWAPFAGGELRDGRTRLELSLGLELTGEAGSDFYKSQERRLLERAFAANRDIPDLYAALEKTEAFRVLAELEQWRAIRSLCPRSGEGLDVAQVLKEDAIVYVQGHLFDSVIKNATKAFIVELIQESRRLVRVRKTHLTVAVDEVSFLTSKPLTQALATSVGFNCNFILAYQSQNDLLNLEDRMLNARYVYQSINVNSQIKAVYASADQETAEWAAALSGKIVKDITKMERTEINEAGGESFEKQRMLGTQEEPYIHSNQILSLPPKVFVFFQPAKLATIGFCSCVAVNDERKLNEHLDAARRREAEMMVDETSSASVQDMPVTRESGIGTEFVEDSEKPKGISPTASPAVSPDEKEACSLENMFSREHVGMMSDDENTHLAALAHITDADDEAASLSAGDQGLHEET